MPGSGAYAEANLDHPDAARLVAQPGQEPVRNQEMVEGLLGAQKGTLDTMFENEDAEIRAEEEAMEGYGSGFDGQEGRGFKIGDVDYGDTNKPDTLPGRGDVETEELDEVEMRQREQARAEKDSLTGVPLDFIPKGYQEYRGHG